LQNLARLSNASHSKGSRQLFISDLLGQHTLYVATHNAKGEWDLFATRTRNPHQEVALVIYREHRLGDHCGSNTASASCNFASRITLDIVGPGEALGLLSFVGAPFTG